MDPVDVTENGMARRFLHYGQCDFTQLRRVIEILVDIKLSAPNAQCGR